MAKSVKPVSDSIYDLLVERGRAQSHIAVAKALGISPAEAFQYGSGDPRLKVWSVGLITKIGLVGDKHES